MSTLSSRPKTTRSRISAASPPGHPYAGGAGWATGRLLSSRQILQTVNRPSVSAPGRGLRNNNSAAKSAFRDRARRAVLPAGLLGAEIDVPPGVWRMLPTPSYRASQCVVVPIRRSLTCANAPATSHAGDHKLSDAILPLTLARIGHGC
jgi:hypothetical protein